MSSAFLPLVHVGYHKCASTWLQEVVFQPECGYLAPWDSGVSFDVLIHVNPFTFSPEAARRQLAEGIEQARARHLVPVLSNEALSGNQYEAVFPSKEVADRLKLIFPQARILIAIREQTDMLLSWYKHYVRARLSLSLRDYLACERSQRLAPPFRRELLEYHLLIGYYQQLFGKQMVLVLPIEELRRDGLAFVNAINSFTGAARLDKLPMSRPVNEGWGGLTVAWLRYWNKLTGADRSRLAWRTRWIDALGGRLFWQLDRIIPASVQRARDRALREEVNHLLGDHYAPSNRQTAQLTGLDLATLGYRL